jgi:pyruvate formate-lyase 1-activating enzyme
MAEIIGKIHSLQSLGAVDGPGLRFLVFMQGCPLRCVYCHNPDTWAFEGGMEMNADTLLKKILRYKPYFKNGGGVTVSGGEPLMQPDFIAELFRLLKENGIHTALDTSCSVTGEKAEMVLQYTDMVLADLKFATEHEYQKYCRGSLQRVEDFLRKTEEMKIPLWVRHVIVPGINDCVEDMWKIREKAEKYSNLEKIEWLPYHNLCIEKYESMKIPFPLRDTPNLSKERLQELIDGIYA